MTKLLILIPLFATLIFLPQRANSQESQSIGANKKTSASVLEFVREINLRNHVDELAGDAYDGRGAGYSGETIAATYIAHQFERYGLLPVGDKVNGKKTYFQKFSFNPRRSTKPNQVLVSRNVLGFIEGTDPQLKHEIIVIGAHHDGQGKTGQADGGRLPSENKNPDEIWNSADDNASSIAALLETARIVAEKNLRPGRSILFITFGAEEHALNGSFHYVNNPVFTWDRHSAMLNLEKLGRIPDATPITASSSTSPLWATVTANANKRTGLKVESLLPEIIADTDHYPFALRKLPAMVIGMAHEEDTHRPTDSSEKITFDKLTARTAYVLTVLLELTNSAEKMHFTGDLGREPGLMVVMPNENELDASNLDPQQGGLKVSAIMPALAAYRSGLRVGDIILEIDGKSIKRNEDAERRPRQSFIDKGRLSLTIVRNGKKRKVEMK